MIELIKGNANYSIENKILHRLNELKSFIVKKEIKLDYWEIRHAIYKTFGDYDYFDEWHELKIGDFWAKSGETAFIKKDIVLKDWKGEYVALFLDTDGEGLLHVNGKPFHGVDNFRGYICLTDCAKENEIFNLLIEHKAGGYEDFEPTSAKHIFKDALICAIDKEIESIYYDYLVAYDVGSCVKDEYLSKLMLNLVYDSILSVDWTLLRDQIKKALKEENVKFREKLKSLPKAPGQVHFIGNSHIDLVFMWPERETHRKVGRTFNSLCRLMEEFPNYYFMCSQVPVYEFLKKYYPETYDKIKEFIKQGRFEPIGGTYVQNSTNLVNGESQVRQCLYGKRFFKKEFDFDVKIGWLPDTFGFAYSLPQIYKQAGITSLITQKLRYNDMNAHIEEDNIPELVFNWEGVDGSRILMYNTGSYKHLTTDNMDFMLYNIEYYKNKTKHLPLPEYLAPYGYGDGGGGVNRRELEYIKRLGDTPGFPKVSVGTVSEFMERLPKENLSVYNDELYLEAHRGTYTSQTNIKRLNRVCETGIRNCEILGVISDLYDKEKLTECWKKLLFNQFHDILPGSSINEGVKDAEASFENLNKEIVETNNKCLKQLADKADTQGMGTAIFVYNPLSFKRKSIVSLDKKENITGFFDQENNAVLSQIDGDKMYIETEILPFSGKVFYGKDEAVNNFNSPFEFENNVIYSPFYNIVIGDDGYISQIYDKENDRNVLCGRSNVFQTFEDKGGHFDAWDIDPLFEKNQKEFLCIKKPEMVECGALYATIEAEYEYNNSKIIQKMKVYANSRRIDFETKADWNESHIMLKVLFSVDIRAKEAAYEIPYGYIKRPTTRNNRFEKAKFEVCGQRWADLSEPGYGVSLLNDCKYGYDIKDSNMRLTLLRSPKWPDAATDMHEHNFVYSLFPHKGCDLEETVKEAHSLNNPLYAIWTDNHNGEKINSFLTVKTDNVIVDCIKKAEDSESIVVRVYEPYGKRGNTEIVFDKPLLSVSEVNILEEAPTTVDFEDNKLKFYIKPFEIKTFLLR